GRGGRHARAGGGDPVHGRGSRSATQVRVSRCGATAVAWTPDTEENAMPRIRAWAAHAAGQPLVPFEFDPGPLAADEVEVAVEHCGICHSDLSVLNDEWSNSIYPVVPGHEAVGRIVAVGPQVRHLRVGQRVGVGWASASC